MDTMQSQRKAEHDAAEAQRKNEWDTKQAEKQAAVDMVMQEVIAMTDDDVAAASIKRLGDDAERLTRRNMKICITEYVQALCQANPQFARIAMHPKKTMMNCFRYINRLALQYIKDEMQANGETATGNIMMGGDVPDDLCYQWAEAYFIDPNAEEDKDKEDEFIPKKFYGGSSPAIKAKPTAPVKPVQMDLAIEGV